MSKSAIPASEDFTLTEEEDEFLLKKDRLNVTIKPANPAWESFLSAQRKIFFAQITESALRETRLFVSLKQDIFLTIFFVDNIMIQTLNREYRQKNAPTDVLSFPVYSTEEINRGVLKNEPELHLGDLFIAREYCLADAENMKIPFQNHIAHMVTHGVLHLCGYDHMTASEAAVMEKQEKNILAQYDIADPFRDKKNQPETINLC